MRSYTYLITVLPNQVSRILPAELSFQTTENASLNLIRLAGDTNKCTLLPCVTLAHWELGWSLAQSTPWAK